MNREGKFFVTSDVILNIDKLLPGFEVDCLNLIGVYLRVSAANDWVFFNEI